MSEELRIVKLESLVMEIGTAFYEKNCGLYGKNVPCYNSEIFNPSLLLIYDYCKLNEYGKVIVDKSMSYFNSTCCEYYKMGTWYSFAESFSEWKDFNETEERDASLDAYLKVWTDCKERLHRAKAAISTCKLRFEKRSADIINYVNKDANIYAYDFIFWSLMVLAVDKSNADEHLTLICDFAKALNLSDDEIEDIAAVVLVVFRKNKDYKFKTKNVPSVFEKVISLYM